MFGIITLLNPSCRQVLVMSVTQDENIDISCSSTETDGMSKSPESNQIADACVLGFLWLSSYFGSGPTLLYVGKYPPTYTHKHIGYSYPAIQGKRNYIFRTSSWNLWNRSLNVNIEWFERDSLWNCFHLSAPCVYKVSGHFYRKRTGLLTFSKEESHLFSLLHIQRFNLKPDL